VTIVDDKGRLFGKINLLDLAIILVVLAVAGYLGYKMLGKGQAAPATAGEDIEVTFKLSMVEEATIKALPVGAQIRENQSAAKPVLGKVVAVQQKPTMITVMGPEGKTMGQTEAKDKFDYYITVRGPGRETADSVSMGGIDMKVGRTYFLISKLWGGSGVGYDLNLHPAKRD
jgi:hypothetical protein